MGGLSAEREVSLDTGGAVLNALRRQGVDAHAVDPRDDAVRALLDGGYDAAWIALHGRGGEDGSIQGLLEYLQLPYTGSGVAASALCIDKLRAKQVMRAVGLATPDWAVVASQDDIDEVADHLGFPLMVKPASEGSSVGMRRVESRDEFAAALVDAQALDACVIAEQWITGAEYTAAVLGREVLPMIRIEAAAPFYDYEAKYHSDETRYRCPCGLPPEIEQAYGILALHAFDALGASGWGRVDFMLADDGVPQFLEVNTIPGMTGHSLVPMAASQAGMDFDALVMRILALGLETQRHLGKELCRGA